VSFAKKGDFGLLWDASALDLELSERGKEVICKFTF
jgi:hypothetical protein